MIWIVLSIVVAFFSLASMLMTKRYYSKKLKDIEIEVCGRIEKEILLKIKENEHIAGHLSIAIAVVEQHRKFNISQIDEIKIMMQDVRDQRAKVMAIHNDNMALLNAARKEIKDNKQQQFYVKESSLWLYDHYKKVVELLDKAIRENMDYQEIFALHETATNNMICVRDYFVKYFNMLPESYANQKIYMTGDTGDQLKFSKN